MGRVGTSPYGVVVAGAAGAVVTLWTAAAGRAAGATGAT